jgi:hypothetical protein
MLQVRIAACEQRRADIRWPAGLDVAGVVVDSAGGVVPGAYLRAASQDREKVAAEGVIETRADEQGRFGFRHLAPGRWNLMAGRSVLYGTQVSIVAGTRDVRIVLPANGRR